MLLCLSRRIKSLISRLTVTRDRRSKTSNPCCSLFLKLATLLKTVRVLSSKPKTRTASMKKQTKLQLPSFSALNPLHCKFEITLIPERRPRDDFALPRLLKSLDFFGLSFIRFCFTRLYTKISAQANVCNNIAVKNQVLVLRGPRVGGAILTCTDYT